MGGEVKIGLEILMSLQSFVQFFILKPFRNSELLYCLTDITCPQDFVTLNLIFFIIHFSVSQVIFNITE